MKLLRYTYTRLFAVLFVIFGLWALFFYFSMIGEVMDETDDRLLNNKGLVVHRMLQEPWRLQSADTINDNYKIKRISKEAWMNHQNKFYDSKIYIQMENEYEPMRVYQSAFQTTDESYYHIELYLSTIERDNVIRSILIYLLVLYGLLLGVGFVGMRLVLNRAFRPLYKLLNWLNALSPDKEVPALNNETEILEFSLLNMAAVDMQSRSRKAYDDQKDFIGNASHELQTPLAVALNKIEMLANEESLTEKQMQLLGDVFDSLQRASKLNKSLLLLSKLQNDQSLNKVELNLTDVLKRIVDDMIEVYASKALEVEIIVDADFMLQTDESLLVVLLNNLLKNAIVHSPNHGNIRIESAPNYIKLYNDGSKALDVDKIFQRFYHSDAAETKSTGLGLSIAKEIAQLLGLELLYSFDGQHCFSLKI